MYDTFDECLRALLRDEGLDAARGGQITKDTDGTFNRRLHGQFGVEGDIIFELVPATTPEVKWRALSFTEESDEAYRAFISDPQNSHLVQT